MDRTERQEKMKLLQVKAKRKILARELLGVFSDVSVEDFLTIDETIFITEKIYTKINELKPIQIKKSKDSILETLEEIKERIDPFLSEKVLLLHYRDRETGAMLLPIRDIWRDLEATLLVVGLSYGVRDFVFADKNLSFGICVDRLEYFNNLYTWGI